MKIILLLVDILEENKIPPDKLYKVLQKYLLMVQQYITTPDLEKQEMDYILGKEIESAIGPFLHLLDYSSMLKKK